MAEEENVVSTGHTSDSLTECPLCSQQLRCPRSLPCFHTFCEECLQTAIMSQSEEPNEEPSFQCPACRNITYPADSKQNRKEWAVEFPANKTVVVLTSKIEGKAKRFNCYPCGKKGQDIAATVWWKRANLYLCDSCKKNDLIPEDDTLVSIDADFLPSISCSKHLSDVDMICDDHHSICCSKCIAADHRRCDTIHNYAEFVERMRTSESENLLNKLQNSIETMAILVKDLKSRIEEILGDRDGFIDEVKQLRKKIDEQLDELQKTLTDEADAAFNEKKEELDGLIQKCELMKGCMMTTKNMTETEQIQKNDEHMVLTFQKGEMEIEAGRRLVKEIAEPYLTAGLTHKIEKTKTDDDNNRRRRNSDDENTENVDGTVMLLSGLSLGPLETTRKSRDFPVESSVLLPLSLLDAFELNEIETKTPSDKNDCKITGLAYLPDGRFLVSDNGNEKLKLFSVDGNLIDELEIASCRDICMKNAETVAVTKLEHGTITHVNVESRRKLALDAGREIRTNSRCDAIALGKDCYVVGSAADSISYDVFRMTGESRCDFSWSDRIIQGVAYDPHSDSVLYTQYNTRNEKDKTSVFRILPDHTTIEVATVSDQVSGATGLDLDQDGNIYVCCCTESNNIVQISKHGKIRSLVDISDPYRIAVCGKKFVVSKENESTITLFELR